MKKTILIILLLLAGCVSMKSMKIPDPATTRGHTNEIKEPY